MQRHQSKPYSLRIETAKEERRPQRQGGFNDGIDQVIWQAESDRDWEAFIEEEKRLSRERLGHLTTEEEQGNE